VAWAVNVRSSNFPRDLGILVRLGSAELGFLREVFIIITCCLTFWPRGWHNTRAQVLEYGTGREVLSLWWFGWLVGSQVSC